MMDDRNTRLFLLGRVVATPTALEVTTEEERHTFLLRHQIGSWEETQPEDRQSNMLAIFQDLRILTVHSTQSGHKVWIITEADRSATTMLLPEEY